MSYLANKFNLQVIYHAFLIKIKQIKMRLINHCQGLTLLYKYPLLNKFSFYTLEIKQISIKTLFYSY
jgi:hypothetical protein